MNNLFSVFDPSDSILWKLNWVSSCTCLVLIPSVFWLSHSQYSKAHQNLLTSLSKEINLNFGTNPVPGHTHWVVALFLFILSNNIMGLTPYTFTASSHLSFTLSLGLASWIGYYTYSSTKDPTHALAHLLPMGTPYLLMPLMVMIEIISNIIRPLTLSVRLAANMVAGHLLMTLVASPLAQTPYTIGPLIFSALIALMVLETAVSFIQAYVFSMLSSLYVADSNYASLS